LSLPRPAVRLAFRLAIALLLWPVAAQAYVDPGTGLLMLQGLFAALGALVIFVRHPIKTVRRLIARFRGRDEGS
jgi:hypothetical protein